MKTTILIIALFVSGQVSGETVPEDVSEIIAKLEDFETDQRRKTEATISKKRVEVARFLEKALDRETRAGNLEVALTIKEEITRLSATTVEIPSSTKPERNSSDWSSERAFARWLDTVEVWDQSEAVVRYVKDGAVVTFNKTNNKEIPREAKIDGQRIEWIFEGDNSTVCALDFKSDSEVEITLKRGTDSGIVRPRDRSRR